MMAVSIAETHSCWKFLQFVCCWRILCWFYLTVNKTGMGNHLKIVFAANSSQRDRKFNLCYAKPTLPKERLILLSRVCARRKNNIPLFTKMKRILHGDSKVSKHRVWYPRALLVRPTVSRSLDWSTWSRGWAPKVSKTRHTWFFTCGGIWRPWCNRWKYKMWNTKITHYRCFCAPNTRCAKGSSPWVGEKNPYVLSKCCCPYRAGLVNKVTIFPIYWDFRITL